MFNRKYKRYKLKNLYVADIYKVTDKTFSHFEDLSKVYDLTSSYLCLKIVYFNFDSTYINPLTKEKYKVRPSFIGDIYCSNLNNISTYFDIPDEIILRGDYLTLEEILKYSKKLENREKK